MNLFAKKKQIDRNCCKHIFEIMREASANTTEGYGGEIHPSVSKCKKCGVILETSNAIQHSAYQDQANATSILAITTIIAFTTLILVTIGFYFDYLKK